MRRPIILLLALLLAAPAAAQNLRTSPSAQQLPGTATSDSANAGNLGEVMRVNALGTTATITVTIATPAVVTWTNHGYTNCTCTAAVNFTNSGGALPTGISSGTTYYVIGSSVTTNTFQIATSVANALAGTAVNTSGSQSGTQTGLQQAILANATGKTLAAITLTPGDWDIWGVAQFTGGASTTVTYLQGMIYTSVDTAGVLGPDFFSSVYYAGGTVYGSLSTVVGPTVHPGPTYVHIAANTTYYLNAITSFGVSTASGFGVLTARRRR